MTFHHFLSISRSSVYMASTRPPADSAADFRVRTSVRLTKRLIDRTACPAKEQLFLRDRDLPGFALRITLGDLRLARQLRKEAVYGVGRLAWNGVAA